MISVTSAQLDAWLAMLAFPLARVLGMFAIVPVFGSTAVPRRIRLVLGLVITFALVPGMPAVPAVSPGSWTGVLIIAQQMVLGILMGLTLRIVFSTVDVAGEMIGLQMGLSFALFYDPQSTAQTPVLSELLGLMTTLIFLAMNGHLLTLSVLAESFKLLPVGVSPVPSSGYAAIVSWAAVMFSTGVLLALPVVSALLIANIAMGVLARVAPQLNLFAVGFPVTLFSGFAVLTISLPYVGTAMERLFDQGFLALRNIIRITGG